MSTAKKRGAGGAANRGVSGKDAGGVGTNYSGAPSQGSATPMHTDGASSARSAADAWSVDALLADRAVDTVVCCGAGGVGKTTTAAALAVRAAEQGRHVVVLTIDPAKRLAQSLGLAELDNTPRPVGSVNGVAGGSLAAMMLDMKRTFDDVVYAHTTPEKAAAIVANPFYEAMSTSFAGTSEYMAMEKLGQLRQVASVAGGSGEEPWDLIVVDTPPSRSALDFLDAPHRLSSFLDGRMIRVLTAPARAGGRFGAAALSSVMGPASVVMSKLLGQQTLTDVQTFAAAMDTMFGGFRQRAEHTYQMLRGAGTAFVVVAGPDADSLREASFFVDRLAGDGMPLAGVVVNRVTPEPVRAGQEQVAAVADGGDPVVAGLVQVAVAQWTRRAVELAAVAEFAQRHARVRRVAVPLQDTDVVDVAALRRLGALLNL